MNSYGKLMLAASLGLTSGVSLAADVISYFNHSSALNAYQLGSTQANANGDVGIPPDIPDTDKTNNKITTDLLAKDLASYFGNMTNSKLTLLNHSSLNSKPSEQRFLRFQQSYRGFNIWDQQLVLMLDENGNLAQAYGQLVNNIDKDLPQLPQISRAQQNNELERFIKDKFSDQERVFRHKSVELVIYVDKAKTARLAYKFSFFTDVINANSRPQKILAFVDAINGEQLAQHDVLHRVDVGGAGPSGNNKQSWPNYVATDIDANPPTTFTIRKEGDETNANCFFDSLNVETRNYNHDVNAVNQPYSFDCTTSVTHTKSYHTAKSPLNDAHYYAQITKLMYQDYLGQEPFKGEKIIQNVHYGQNMDQAFYESGQVYYGDGDFLFYPMVALDVVAHEIAHGFTEEFGSNSTKVMLTGQARAINEAFSDISGAAAEFYLRGTNDWQSNYESYQPAGKALRYMDDPKADGVSIDHVNDYNSTTESHHAAGVFNKAFHRLVTMDMGDGKANPWDTKLAFILFANANQNCWIATSAFTDAANCVMQQAWTVKSQLNSANSGYWSTDELKNHVRKAFAQVGIDLASNKGLESDFSFQRSFLKLDFQADSRQAGGLVTSRYDKDQWQWDWDFGDTANNTANTANPSHTFSASGDYQVSLTTTSPYGDSDTYSIPVTVADDYCSAQGLNFDKYYIESVTINGTPNDSSGVSSGYSDYQALSMPVLNGTSFNVNIVAGQPSSSKDKTKNFYLWLDRNHDGLYSSSELEYSGSAKDQITTSVSVAGVSGESFNVRTMVSFGLLTQACGDFSWGEVEDYVVTIDETNAAPILSVAAVNGVNIVTFNNTTNDARITSWEWNFDDGSLPYRNKTTSHKYAQSGHYDVTVKAYYGSKQTSVTLPVDFTSTTTPAFTPVVNDRSVTVNADQSIMPEGSTVKWDFGDGSTTQLESFTHTYQTDGVKTIKLTITNPDNPNGTQFIEHDVTIGQNNYTPAFTSNVTAVGDGTFNVVFNNNSQVPTDLNDVDNDALLSWSFGDGSSKTVTSANFDQGTSHIYNADGSYQVTLSISYTNSNGDTITKSLTQTLELVTPASVNYCQAVGFTDYEHIASVNFANAGVMTNVTGSTTVVNPNNPIQLSADGENSYIINSDSLYAENYHVWIDMNGDGLFGDGDWRNEKSERVISDFDRTTGDEGTGSVSGVFTLPAGKFASGSTITTRMRVIQYYSASRTDSIDPCSDYPSSGNGEGGEIEDYLVTITKN